MELLAKAKSSEFWKDVREKECFRLHREELLEMWEQHCNNDILPAFNYSKYKLFWTTGDRTGYEKQYFNRRHALNCSVLLSLIYPEEEKYREKLNDILFAVCDEYSWCLPAHQGDLDTINEIKLDLFATETGFTLSEIYTIAGDHLDPLIKNRIKKEVDRRIVAPFTAVDNYGSWENWNTNWTAVCMGSVACTLMLMHPELVDEKMTDRFIASMEKYLSGLGNDGICLEGCGYWHYGFGFFTVFADMIRDFTDGNIDYFKKEKVCAVSQFIQNSLLNETSCITIADSGGIFSYHLGLLHYLKSQYPNQIRVYDPKYSINSIGCARFCLQLRSFTWFNEDYYNSPTPINDDFEYYAQNSQWLIKRTSNYGFVAKAGNNAEPHNHNDIGSFIFAKNGHQAIIDIGAGRYTRQYFHSDTRYTIIENSSRSHSVPIIGGEYQAATPKAKATDVKYENGIFSMNIASAYLNSGIERIDRMFELAEDSVKLTDSYKYEGNHAVVERLVSYFEPQIIRHGKILLGDTTVRYDPSICTCRVSSEATTRDPNMLCYMIDFELRDGVKVFTCTIQ